MKIGYIVKEATSDYFYFTVDPKEVNKIGIGSILKVIINNTPYYAIIESLKSEAIEEERLFDFEAIDIYYGKIEKKIFLIYGKAIFIGGLINEKVVPEKPSVPPIPGDPVYLPEDWEIEKIYKFDDKYTITIGKIRIQNKDFYIQLLIKNLLIKHTGIFGITGSGKSTTVAHLVNELTNKGIPIFIFDVHRDYIFSYDTAIVITFSNREKELIEKIAREKNRKIKVYTAKLRLNLLGNYSEEFLGIQQKQYTHVFNVLVSLLKKNPSSLSELLDWIDGKSQDINKIFEKYPEGKRNEIRLSLKSRLSRIYDWNIFSRDSKDYGDDLFVILDNIIEKIRTFGEELETYEENGEILLKRKNEKNLPLVIFDLYPLSIEEQRILLDIVLEYIYNKYKRFKLEGNPDILGIVIEEAHRFAAKDVKTNTRISMIAREGRKFGLGLIIVSQIPSKIIEDIISQLNTFIFLKIINPKDLEFIRRTCPYLTKEYFDALTKLEVGKCLVVGSAVKNPSILSLIKTVEVGGAEEDIERKIKERVEKFMSL